MKKILAIFLVFFAGNVFPINKIVAIVDNNPISLYSIQNELLTTSSDKEKLEILNAQIDIILQLKKVDEFNLKPTEEDISKVLIDIAQSNNLSIDELLNRKELNDIKNKVSEKLSILNLQRYVTKDLEVPIKQILNECSGENLSKDQKQIKIAQIIISEIDSEINNPEQKNILIESFLNKLSNHISKGASFKAFAKLHSQHPSYKDGGVTEWLTVNNPTLEMLNSLDTDEVSEIYLTDFGFAIAIKIDERYISSKLKECEEQIIYKNAESYYAKWLENLKEQAFIKIYYDKLI